MAGFEGILMVKNLTWSISRFFKAMLTAHDTLLVMSTHSLVLQRLLLPSFPRFCICSFTLLLLLFLRQRLSFSLGATLFAAANNTLQDDEEPSFTQDFDDLLTHMTEDHQHARIGLHEIHKV